MCQRFVIFQYLTHILSIDINVSYSEKRVGAAEVSEERLCFVVRCCLPRYLLYKCMAVCAFGCPLLPALFFKSYARRQNSTFNHKKCRIANEIHFKCINTTWNCTLFINSALRCDLD